MCAAAFLSTVAAMAMPSMFGPLVGLGIASELDRVLDYRWRGGIPASRRTQRNCPDRDELIWNSRYGERP